MITILKSTPPNKRNMGDSLGPVVKEFARLGVTRRDMADWRVVSVNGKYQPFGSIQGLDTLHGKCLCTNGVECLVETPIGWFIGHFKHFILDKKTKVNKTEQIMNKYLQL